MKKNLLGLFLIVSIGELMSVVIKNENLQFIFKPMIMITLGLYYLASHDRYRRSYLLICAILFSFLGDVFLLFEEEMFFMLGLGSFLLAHLFMVLNALFRYGRTTSASFWMVFFGALLFMASDSLLAVNKFMMPIYHAHIWIMLTYISAQFLIVDGLLH